MQLATYTVCGFYGLARPRQHGRISIRSRKLSLLKCGAVVAHLATSAPQRTNERSARSEARHVASIPFYLIYCRAACVVVLLVTFSAAAKLRDPRKTAVSSPFSPRLNTFRQRFVLYSDLRRPLEQWYTLMVLVPYHAFSRGTTVQYS